MPHLSLRSNVAISRRTGDDVYLVLDTLSYPHARLLLAIEAHGVRLVQEGKGPVLVGHVTEVIQLLKGVDGASLGVNSLQRIQLTSFGTDIPTLHSSMSRCSESLCLKMCLGTPLLRIPRIMLACFPSSEKISHPGQVCRRG